MIRWFAFSKKLVVGANHQSFSHCSTGAPHLMLKTMMTLANMIIMMVETMMTRMMAKRKKERKKPWQASGEGESVRTGAPRLLLPVSPATLQHWKTFSFPSSSYMRRIKIQYTLQAPLRGGRLYQHFSFFKSFSTCFLSLNNLLH